MKLKDSTRDAFKVEVGQPADLDDLKNAIRAKFPGVYLEFVYYKDEHGISKCDPGDIILSHGQCGLSSKNPYYYTTEIPPQARKHYSQR